MADPKTELEWLKEMFWCLTSIDAKLESIGSSVREIEGHIYTARKSRH